MRRVLILLCIPFLFLLAGATVFGQQSSLSFPDGFGIELTRGYTLTVAGFSKEGAEAVVEVIAPDGSTIYGIIVYDDTKWLDDQSYIMTSIYDVGSGLYSGEGLTGKVSDLEYDALTAGTDCYWAKVINEEGAYAILAVDLFPSPGKATGIFFCFPPFFGLGYEEQLAVLRELFLGLTITFSDAAG